MHLTRRTDYGLRLLMLLAVDDEAPLGLNDAATRLDVSANHLAKVAQALVHAEMIRSIRGRTGGFMLLPATLKATVADILIVVGGVIPPRDQPKLLEMGVAAVYPPGTVLTEAASEMLDKLQAQLA